MALQSDIIEIDPEDIRFSQDRINKRFGECLEYSLIGEILDEIIHKARDVSELTSCMTVSNYKNYGSLLFTANNRTLWILKQLKKKKIIEKIKVNFVRNYIENLEVQEPNFPRFTTKDNGKSVIVRGDPGGHNTEHASFWEPLKNLNEVNEEDDEIDNSDEEYGFDSDEEYFIKT